MPRPRRKVILFIVEGESDYDALYTPIAKLLEDIDEELLFDILTADGDVTSDFGKDPNNMNYLLNRYYFKPFFKEKAQYFYPRDVVRVIHLIDTDGCFLPDSHMKLWEREETVDFPYYEPPYIFHEQPENMVKRNDHKTTNIRYFKSMETIQVISKTVPYEIYYFSCNIDHCLNGVNCLNLCTREKKRLAERFAEAHETDSKLFLDTMRLCLPPLDEPTYDSTWDFITQGENSINRYSNLYIGLKKLVEDFSTDKQNEN